MVVTVLALCFVSQSCYYSLCLLIKAFRHPPLQERWGSMHWGKGLSPALVLCMETEEVAEFGAKSTLDLA